MKPRWMKSMLVKTLIAVKKDDVFNINNEAWVKDGVVESTVR